MAPHGSTVYNAKVRRRGGRAFRSKQWAPPGGTPSGAQGPARCACRLGAACAGLLGWRAHPLLFALPLTVPCQAKQPGLTPPPHPPSPFPFPFPIPILTRPCASYQVMLTPGVTAADKAALLKGPAAEGGEHLSRLLKFVVARAGGRGASGGPR